MTAEGPPARTPGGAVQGNQTTHPAIAYAVAGWRVLPLWGFVHGRCECGADPCRATAKHPRAVGVHGASSDPRIVAGWVAMYPRANWAIAMGGGMFAVDEDRRNGGDTSLAAWQQEHGALPPTLTNLTGNGRHFIYALSPGTDPPRNDEWLTGVDIKSEGGYIVVPPSRHPSGAQYAWKDTAAAVTEAPAHLTNALPRRGEVSTSPKTASAPGGVIITGTRNPTLTALAGSMRRYGASEATILTALRGENAERCDVPLDDDELRTIARSIAGYEPEPFDPVYVEFANSLMAQLQPPSNERALRGGHFVLDEPEQLTPLWGRGADGLWLPGEGFMIDGPQGVGKTTILQQLVLHRIGVRAGDFLGLPVMVETERPHLLLAMDRPRQFARSFRRMVTEADRERLDAHLVVWRGPLPGNPLASTGWLADFIEQICPGVGTVLVDSVKDLAPGLSKDEVGAALNSAWQEVIARGVELVLLHHERKAGNGAQRTHSLDDVFGSTWLTAGLGSVVVLDAEPGDPTVELRHIKQPANPVGPLTLRHDHAAGRTTVHTGALDLDQILWAAGDIGVTPHDCAQALYGRVSDSDLAKVRRALGRFVASGRVVKQAGQHSREGRTPDRYALSPEHRWAQEQEWKP